MADEKEPGEVGGGAATAEGQAEESVLESAVSRARERRDETVPFQVISEKPLPQSSREVVVEVPRPEWNTMLDEFFKEVKPSAAIEGFRKGKVPMKILQRRFTREASAQLVERITPNIVREYEKQKETTLYGVPAVTDFQTEGNDAIRITLQLEVKPDIDPQNYTDLTIEAPGLQLKDEMVEKRIEELRAQAATFEEADKELTDKDAVVLDLQGVDSKGHTVLQETNKLYDNPHEALPHALAHALFGKKAGETVEAKGAGPDGKGDVRYTATIKSVKELRLPNVDDEFAVDMGAQNLEGLKTQIQEQLQKAIDNANKDEAFEVLVDKLVETHDFEVPPALKAHVEKDIARQDYAYMSRTGLTPPRLRGLSSRAEYQAELDRAAEQRVKGFLLLDAIGRKENISAEESDINEALEERAQQEGRKAVAVRAALERRKELTNFVEQVRFNKIREHLLAKTTVTYVERPDDEEVDLTDETTETAAAEGEETNQ